MTAPAPLLDVALAAHRAGLCVIPVREDGTKRPDGPWKQYQHTRPTEDQVATWWANGRAGIGLVCGAVSGNLELLELDDGGIDPTTGELLDREGQWRAFVQAARDAGLYDLLDRVIDGYAERTPGDGVHLLYRCDQPVDGNMKLARRPATTAELAETPSELVKVIFETRGEGGFVVVAPSSGRVHPTGRPWRLLRGGFDTIATITAAERRQLLDLARSFDRMPAESPDPAPRAEVEAPTFNLPAAATPSSWMDATVADFNARTTWADILGPHGWVDMGAHSGVGYWCRPGKNPRDGHSATTNANGTDRLILWSTSVAIPGVDVAGGGPHQPSYDRFAVWAGYHHAGDRLEAAKDLRRRGYGPPWTENDDLDPWAMAGLERPPANGTTPGTDSEPAPPAGLAIRWTDELAANPPPEPPVLVDGILRRGELVALAAPRGIGKTWIAYNLAHLLATGDGHLFGRLPVRQAANVLYLQGELDEHGSYTRWLRIAGHDTLDAITTGARPVPRVAESFERVRIRTITRRTTTKVDGVVCSDEHVDAVIDPRIEAAIVDHGIDVVIVDPWAVYFSGKENSNDEVEAALAKLRDITLRTGVAWVVIHHISAKIEQNRLTEPEDLWRGATRLADWASTRITMLPHYSEARRRELGLTRHEARRHVDVHFLRRGAPVDDFSARRGDDGWWEPWEDPDARDHEPTGAPRGPGGRPPALSVVDLVQALIADGGEWPSMSEAAAVLDVSRAALERVAHQAVRLGHVAWTTGPKNAKGLRLRTHEDLSETRAAGNAGDLLETLSDSTETAHDQGQP